MTSRSQVKVFFLYKHFLSASCLLVSRAVCSSVSWFYTKHTIQRRQKKQKVRFRRRQSPANCKNPGASPIQNWCQLHKWFSVDVVDVAWGLLEPQVPAHVAIVVMLESQRGLLLHLFTDVQASNLVSTAGFCLWNTDISSKIWHRTQIKNEAREHL